MPRFGGGEASVGPVRAAVIDLDAGELAREVEGGPFQALLDQGYRPVNWLPFEGRDKPMLRVTLLREGGRAGAAWPWVLLGLAGWALVALQAYEVLR